MRTWGEYLERAGRGDYDMAVMGWQADTMDPNDFLSTLLASESVGSTNRSRYRSTAMDALLKRGRRGGGPAERLAAYAEAQALFQRDMPLVPLYHVSIFWASRRDVHALTVDATGLLRFEKTWKARVDQPTSAATRSSKVSRRRVSRALPPSTRTSAGRGRML